MGRLLVVFGVAAVVLVVLVFAVASAAGRADKLLGYKDKE